MSKSLLSSKTFWFNALTLLVLIASSFGYIPNEEFAGQAETVLIAVAPIINILLRLVTKQSVRI